MVCRKNRWKITQLIFAMLVFASLLLFAGVAKGREIVDMAGRKRTIPERITKVYAAQPYTYVLMSVIAPEFLIGLPGPLSESEKRFVRPEMASLTVLGNGMGPGKQVNMESVLALKPDIVLMKGGPQTVSQRMTEKFDQLGIPVVFVDLESVDKYPAGIEFTADLLGKPARGKALADYSRAVLSKVNRFVSIIPQNKRVRVYYAESADGLATECDQSFHADAIKLAGGVIVHHCELSRHIGMEKISMEQILVYNPEVIVASDPQFSTYAKNDPRWSRVKAVTSGQIFTIPRTPFNWIDRPPTVTRIMGIQWLAHSFYPKQYPIDLLATTSEFQSLFFGVKPSEADLNALFN
jgi:iron complex transport system substrate-binding protein